MPTRITDGPERVLLENILDRNRAALIDTVRGLSDEDARRRLVPSPTTPIALIKHAAAAERIWFQRFLESGGDTPHPGEKGSFAVGNDETLAEVIAEFEHAAERSRMIAAQHDLNETKQHPRAGIVSIRWIYLLMIDEFARHAGHGDILVEQINDMPIP